MTEALGPRLTVRGVARRFVAPDAAEINASVEVERDSRDKAARDAGAAAQQVVSRLTELGGQVSTIDNRRHALTWLLPRVRTYEQFDWDEHKTRRRRGFVASTQLSITVRDLTLLGRVVTVLTSAKAVNIGDVQWLVDDDNPAWAEVRADAISAAIARARHYAAALGAQLGGIEEIADIGLLGSGRDVEPQAERFVAARASSGGREGVSLDPEPQQLSATVEARFRATPVRLDP